MLQANKRCWAEVDLGKIAHNVKEIQKVIPKKTKIMAIVKANSYGHGDIAVARELVNCGVDFFCVACVDEALALRDGGIHDPILVLGYTPREHFHYLHERDITQTLISKDFAFSLQAYCEAQQIQIQAHVKIDTGMSRLGIQCKDECWDIEDVKAMYQLSNIKVTGIFSHFSVSDALDKENADFTKHQIELYDEVLKQLRDAQLEPGLTHLQNSYGILNYPDLAYDYVRPGLLYLGVTSDDALPCVNTMDFQPIMSWKANVSYVKTIHKGSYVSYGRHYQATLDTKIASISVGYADGYPRSVSNMGKEVLIHGQRANIVGNICMDQMMVDVSHIDNVCEGDDVVLFGYDGDVLLSVDELSRAAHTINNETLCWVGARVPRIYKK